MHLRPSSHDEKHLLQVPLKRARTPVLASVALGWLLQPLSTTARDSHVVQNICCLLSLASQPACPPRQRVATPSRSIRESQPSSRQACRALTCTLQSTILAPWVTTQLLIHRRRHSWNLTLHCTTQHVIQRLAPSPCQLRLSPCMMAVPLAPPVLFLQSNPLQAEFSRMENRDPKDPSMHMVLKVSSPILLVLKVHGSSSPPHVIACLTM